LLISYIRREVVEKAIGVMVVTVTSLLLSTVLRGFVLVVLWSWFVVAHFHIAPLTIPVALGISLIVSFLTAHVDLDDKPTGQAKSRLYKAISASLVVPIFTLALGWVYHLFM